MTYSAADTGLADRLPESLPNRLESSIPTRLFAVTPAMRMLAGS
jgi:hypothetical protein